MISNHLKCLNTIPFNIHLQLEILSPLHPSPPSVFKGQLGFGWTHQNASVTALLLLTPATASFSVDAYQVM